MLSTTKESAVHRCTASKGLVTEKVSVVACYSGKSRLTLRGSKTLPAKKAPASSAVLKLPQSQYSSTRLTWQPRQQQQQSNSSTSNSSSRTDTACSLQSAAG